ncbi:hypothetical protein BKA81DRAFT_107667 [Phyllosticta paracitricarpa]
MHHESDQLLSDASNQTPQHHPFWLFEEHVSLRGMIERCAHSSLPLRVFALCTRRRYDEPVSCFQPAESRCDGCCGENRTQ